MYYVGVTHGREADALVVDNFDVFKFRITPTGIPAECSSTALVRYASQYRTVCSCAVHRLTQGGFTYLGDTWVLDIESMTWQEVRCGGHLPNPRYGHSCHLVGSRMFVVGGKGPSGQLYRDVHFLDLVDWTWVEVNATSTGPSPRFVRKTYIIDSLGVVLA